MLARELAGSGVTVNTLHPATYMNTTMVRQSGVTPASSVDEGADAILKLSIGSELKGKKWGSISTANARPGPDAQAYDPDAGKKLGALSMKLTGMSAKEDVPS